MAISKFRFDRAGSTNVPLTVNFSVSGSATFGTDYTVSGADTFTATAGSINIPIGATYAEVTITTIADSVTEGDEYVVLQVIANSNYGIQTMPAVTLTIADDDSTIMLLDQVSVTAAAAYSLRKLRAAYTGAALRVLRILDNAQQDIGFDGLGNLDTAALLSFIGSGTGYIIRWYDQSGNGRDTASAQGGRCVNAGILQTRQGRPSITQSTSEGQPIPIGYLPTAVNSYWTINYVAGQLVGANRRILSGDANSNNNWLLGWWNGFQRSVYFSGTGVVNSGINTDFALQTYTAIGQGNANALLYRNNVDFSIAGNVSSTPPVGNLITNGTLSTEPSDCSIEEIIIWDQAITQNSILQADQMLYYGI
jgi:hypothetical protein